MNEKADDTLLNETERGILDVLRTTYDPEIPVNVYDLGLIYDVLMGDEGDVKVTMTLTAPSCPVADVMPMEIERRLGEVPGVRSAKVQVVWDPPWSPERMSEVARLELGFVE